MKVRRVVYVCCCRALLIAVHVGYTTGDITGVDTGLNLVALSFGGLSSPQGTVLQTKE